MAPKRAAAKGQPQAGGAQPSIMSMFGKPAARPEQSDQPQQQSQPQLSQMFKTPQPPRSQPQAQPTPEDLQTQQPAEESEKPGQSEETPQPKPKRSKAGADEAKAEAKMTTEEWRLSQKGLDELWPQPSYMQVKEGKGHTHYRDETYEIVTRWHADTKISYRPHAKAPGSKSHLRYEEYSSAMSVGQALEVGTWPADWCWDYERGFIKVEGPVRDEPIDISKVTDEKSLTPVDWAILRWYRRELSKKLGVEYNDLVVGKGSGETLILRAHRLVAQREARKRLEAAAKGHRKITEQEVAQTLHEWGFARNPTRTNVMPDGQDWVWSDTLGLLRDRIGDIHLTPATCRYPEVVQLLNKYLLDRLPAEEAAKFQWTSLNLNCNYAARLHRDGNNFGPSFIKAFGEFTGGELQYWPEDDRKMMKLEDLRPQYCEQLDLKRNLVLFNGNCGHAVTDFVGERFSVVYFTGSCHAQAPQECKDESIKLGFNYPTAESDPHSLLRRPRGYACQQVLGSAPPKGSELPAVRVLSAVERDAAECPEGLKVLTPIKTMTKPTATPKKLSGRESKKRPAEANALDFGGQKQLKC